MLTTWKLEMNQHIANGVSMAIAADVSAGMNATAHCLSTRVGASYLKVFNMLHNKTFQYLMVIAKRT